MLILDEVQQLCRIRLVQEVKRTHLQTGGQAADNGRRPLCPQRLLQDILGIFQAALGQVVLRHGHLIELGHHSLLFLRGNLLVIGNLQRQLFDFLIIHVLEQHG